MILIWYILFINWFIWIFVLMEVLIVILKNYEIVKFYELFCNKYYL